MPTGEKDLTKILQGLVPVLNPGEYVFCFVKEVPAADLREMVALFREEEGWTLVLDRLLADRLDLSYEFITAWITLTVHSSLEAVGLTAAFSKVLGDRQISCNCIAAYHHDHIFLPVRDAARAMEALRELAGIT
jgi:hypothetical protein